MLNLHTRHASNLFPLDLHLNLILFMSYVVTVLYFFTNHPVQHIDVHTNTHHHTPTELSLLYSFLLLLLCYKIVLMLLDKMSLHVRKIGLCEPFILPI